MHLYNLDFLRVAFALIIVAGHIIYFLPFYGFKAPFSYHEFGALCDGFFILSGLFMKHSIEKADDFYSYIKPKIIRLWPVLAFSVLCAYIVSKFKIIAFCKYDNLLTLTFINRAFAEFCTGNGCAWYVAVLFWCYALFFCVYKISGKEKFIYVTALISFAAYSVLFKQTNIYNMVPYGGMFTFFMVRGIAGVSGGLLLSCIKRPLHDSEINIIHLKNVFIGLIELTVLYSLFRFCFTKQINFPVFCVFLYALIYLFIKQQGLVSKFLSKKLWYHLGKYSYSIYMMQEIMWPLLNKFLWQNASFGMNNHPLAVFWISNLIIIIVGISTYYLIEKPAYRFDKDRR